jgi:hypothetical protein
MHKAGLRTILGHGPTYRPRRDDPGQHTAAPSQEPIFAKVLSCYDGDTFRLEREVLPGRDQFHLANADTPEIEGQCAVEKQRAIEARDNT